MGQACEEDTWLDETSPKFMPYLLFCTLLILFGGTMSGLQQGLMQLDSVALHIIDENEPNSWKTRLLRPLVKRRHLTLVTLLIANAAAMEALPIFMDVLVPKYVAIAISVTMVVFFGEIIPQAVCLRWPSELGCLLSPLVWVLICLLSPVAYPIAFLLDLLFGAEHYQVYTRAGLGELAREQSQANGRGTLSTDELDVITGALELHGKVSFDIQIPLIKVFKISYDTELTDKVLRSILEHGHSRVPVWRGMEDNIVGLLLVKHLIRVDPKYKLRVADMQLVPLFTVNKNTSLFALLRRFRTGTSHMAAVVARADEGLITTPKSSRRRTRSTESECEIYVTTEDQVPIHAVGILTLEDVIEELLQTQIEDETDIWKPVNNGLDNRIKKVRSLRSDLVSSLEESKKASEHEEDNLLGKGNDSGYGSLNDFTKTRTKNPGPGGSGSSLLLNIQ
mmetsp:Transcript_26809/g.43148  ORF Transcript_26809/g.43148 Transcript_26809/m.43148 type:complete len:450 (-) Transcript_26809:415-1764(-)